MRKLFTFLFAALMSVSMQAQCDLVAVPDPSSIYEPTHIENGSFETQPTMAGSGANRIPNGTNQGWNTTETGSHCFECLTNVKQYHNDNLSPIGNRCVEMNADNAAALYQDLYTYGGDVIRWSLAHAARTKYCGPDEQYMRVDVGAPLYNGNNIVYPTGVNENINTNINPDTKATYHYNGIDNPTGHTYGFNGQNLENLKLNKSADAYQWYYATGVYVIPESQSVTRFAFVSEDNSSCGNLLDDISFSTLIGDLDATYGDNNSVVIKGYWGETDTSKKLIIKINGTPNEVDMTSVSGQNFVITMTYDNKPTNIMIYHEDYVSAARTLSVHYSGFDITANLDPQNAGVYYSTFYHGSVDYALPANVKAYKAAISGSDLLLSEVAAEGDVLPKGNAVILRSSVQNYTLTPSEAEAVTFSANNSLRGVDVQTPNAEAPGYSEGCTIYVLFGTQEDGVGFYRYTGTSIVAHKAYVVVATPAQNAAPRRMPFIFNSENTATDIEIIQPSNVSVQKIIRDGQLIILYEGKEYNAQGVQIK